MVKNCVLQYFAGYGASLHLSDVSNSQWIAPQSSQIILAGILFVISFGCVESPRYLGRNGHLEQAAHALGSLQGLAPNDPQIINELQSIQGRGVLPGSRKNQQSLLQPWIALFGQAANRYRLLFLASTQILAQWSGANAITSKFTVPPTSH